MMKKWMKHVVFSCLLLTCLLYFSVMDASADASYQLRLDGTWMDMAQLPNTYLKPEVAHHYTFTLPYDSLVTFTSRRYTLKNAGFSVEKNGKSYIGGFLDDGLDDSITVALNAGTYTLKIHTKRYWEYSGSYQVRALATSLNTGEKEPNGDAAIAMPLSSGQAVRSVLSLVDDTNDWYTFTVPTSSKVSVSVSVLQGALTFEVYGSDLQKVHKDIFWYYNDAFTVSPSTKTVTYDLDAGEYYVRCYTWNTDGFNKKKNSPDLQNMALYTVQYSRKVPVTSITLSGKDSIGVGRSTTFSAYIFPSDASNQSVKWSSSNPDVAVVDSTGKVTGIRAGSAVIFAVAADGSGVTQSRSIKVTDAGSGGNDPNPQPEALTRPNIFSLVNKSTGIQLSWSKVSNASGYMIYRRKNSGKYTKIATVRNRNSVSYTDTSIISGNMYTYRIRAYRTPSSGSTVYSSYSTEKKGYFISGANLSNIQNVKKGIKITWKKVPGAENYQIYRKTGSGSYQKIKTVSGNLSYTDTNVSYKKKYYYRVRAYSEKSYGVFYSTFSSAKFLTCTKTEKDVSKMQVSLKYYAKKYSGSSLKPSVTVKNEAKTLKQGTDYTVTYENNKNIGLARVTIKGKGSYYGTVVKTFQITSDGKESTLYGSCGENAQWILVDDVLCIYGSGDMEDYESYAPPWLRYAGSIKRIEISRGITSIGAFAFWGCTKAVSVSIPDTVTSINFVAFENCPSLQKLSIPDSVTFIGEGAFSHCSSLKTVNFGNGVKKIATSAFQWCTSLTKITIPDSVTYIGAWAFAGCSSLKTANFGSGLTGIGYDAFNNASGLSKLTFEGNAPQIMGNAFLGVTANVYYPENKSGWAETSSMSYGGNLTWIAV